VGLGVARGGRDGAPATGTIPVGSCCCCSVWGNDVRTDIGSLSLSLSLSLSIFLFRVRYRCPRGPAPTYLPIYLSTYLLLNALRTHGFTHT